VCTRCQASPTPVADHIIAHGITPLPGVVSRQRGADDQRRSVVQISLCALCIGEGKDPATLDQCPRCLGTGLESDSDLISAEGK
jgi:hypothetical protein